MPETKKLTLRHIYKFFKEKYPDICSKYDITYDVFVKVCISYNSKIVREMLFNAYEFPMGSKLGSLMIRTHKTSTTNPKVDFHKTKLLGYTVYHLNEHSNNRYYYTYWKKGPTMNIRSFRFYFNRQNKDMMKRAIRTKMIRTL